MVYITGASGYLGSYLVKKLDPNIRIIPHEAIHTVKLKNADNFYFLSTYGNMSDHQDENKIIKANVTDLVTILSQIDFEKINSFVFVSTSSVKRRMQTFYSRTKKASEELLLAYMHKYNAPITIVRPLSITGIGEQQNHLIPTLIRSCLTGEEMPFVPEPSHDYIDVTDVADGIVTLSKRRAKGIFELGSGTQYSNKEVKDIVEAITGKKANVKIVSNMRIYDSENWVSTNFKARQYGWKPKKVLSQIIDEMVKEYEK